MVRQKIIAIEDEPDILEIVRYNLEKESYEFHGETDGEEGLNLVRRELPDLVLLDVMLPGIDGLEICRRLKYEAATREIPVIMVTARSEESDIVLGLEVGADDYLTKPFGPRELVARVRAVLRRGKVQIDGEDQERVVFDRISIDPARHEVVCDGELLEMTATEFRLLYFLASNPGRVFSRQRLVKEAIGEDVYILDRNIDVHVRSIRKKLGEGKDYVLTVRGVGYRFADLVG
ncbi:DNA-binding response regulator [bacterium]|nr:MAG: DNA-binding response regulator [bacterium]RKZ13309.1 MAG: DNA-binding response regulator [bacterium]